MLLDRELYLPGERTADPERCQEAGVPQGRKAVTKPTLAKQMLERAFAHGVKAAWVARPVHIKRRAARLAA